MDQTGKRVPGVKEKKWTDCVAEDRRVCGITGGWSTAELHPGVWYRTVCEEGYNFMAAWAREEGNAPGNRQREREVEQAGKVEVVPVVTVGSLARFRAALIGSTQGLPKRRRLRR